METVYLVYQTNRSEKDRKNKIEKSVMDTDRSLIITGRDNMQSENNEEYYLVRLNTFHYENQFLDYFSELQTYCRWVDR